MKLALRHRPELDLEAFDPPLTDAQKAAMALDRELVISAGAGAGKTQTLSLRYVSLLLKLAVEAVDRAGRGEAGARADIERVLVLTFTEKAAGEMADRCYRRLLELGLEARAREDDLTAAYGRAFTRGLITQLDLLIDTFDSARISTFHGFCARLLREFPAETDTPAGFEILEPMEANRVRADVVERTLTAFTREEPRVVRDLLKAFTTRRWLLEALDQAVRERAALRSALTQAADGLELAALLTDLPLSEVDVRAWLTDEGAPGARSVADLLAPGGGAWAQSTLGELLARLEALPEDPLELFVLYRDVLDAFTTGEPPKLRTLTHFSVMGKAGDWTEKNAYKENKAALKELQPALAAWGGRALEARGLPNEADRALPHYLKAFARVALAASDALVERYDTMGALDFTDLQSRAVAAVAHYDGLQQLLQARFRYLMVDEFQDTDEAQWALVNTLGRPDGEASDRIFLVGDVKQAIYSFRGGDVTVFRRAAAELGVIPSVLPDNFRSRDDLIGWFNAFFSRALGTSPEGRPEWEAHYEPLTAGRGAPGGGVTLLTHHEPPGAPTNRVEAAAIARMIAGAALTGAAPFEALALADRRIHPSPPIAILLRARTHMLLYEDALREVGVPYIVARGVGFWERPEVVDLANLLHALASGDAISTAGALRSPLFCVADQTLHDLVLGRLGVTSPGRFGREPLDRDAPAALKDADRRWRALLTLRDRVPPSELLRRAMDDAAAWHAYTLADPTGQAEANAIRLVELVSRLERRAGGGLDSVSRHLHAQVEQRARESEAAITPGEARVILMTVHAAKGLEFPVVFVPDLAFNTQARPEPLTVRRLGRRWALGFQVPEAGAPIQRRVKPGRLMRLELLRRMEELAEHKRLFYVAATRARDHLVMLGRESARAASESRTWMQLLERHHGYPLASGDGLEVWPVERALSLAVPRSPEPPPSPSPGPDAARAVSTIEAVGVLEVDDAGLDLFAGCPARWYRRAMLEIPEPGAPVEAAATTHPALEAVADAPGRASVRYRQRWSSVIVRGHIDRLWYDEAGSQWEVLSMRDPTMVPGPLQLLARCRAAAAVLAANDQPPPSSARLLHPDGSETVLQSPGRLNDALDRVLQALVGVAGSSWAAVERAAIAGALPRPCDGCGYRGRGCAGRIEVEG